MNQVAIKKMEIVNALAHVPDANLDEIKKHIDAIIAESGKPQTPVRSLKGVWKGKGFEKISDLEGELGEVRRRLANAILKKQL